MPAARTARAGRHYRSAYSVDLLRRRRDAVSSPFLDEDLHGREHTRGHAAVAQGLQSCVRSAALGERGARRQPDTDADERAEQQAEDQQGRARREELSAYDEARPPAPRLA